MWWLCLMTFYSLKYFNITLGISALMWCTPQPATTECRSALRVWECSDELVTGTQWVNPSLVIKHICKCLIFELVDAYGIISVFKAQTLYTLLSFTSKLQTYIMCVCVCLCVCFHHIPDLFTEQTMMQIDFKITFLVLILVCILQSLLFTRLPDLSSQILRFYLSYDK